jgi:TatA/E family protein of Tat protein translocase
MPFIGNIGAPELIIILVIALVVLGPGKLPDVAQSLGKSVREFRKAVTDVSDATKLEPDKPSAALPGSSVPPPNTLADASAPNKLDAAPAPKPASTHDDAAAS